MNLKRLVRLHAPSSLPETPSRHIAAAPRSPIKTFLFALLFALPLPALAQTTGEVDLKYLGIRFAIPEGWVGQEVDGGYLLGSHTKPGLVLLTLHELKSVEALRSNAAQGIYEQGIMLQPAGAVQPVGQHGVGGEFAGTINGEQVKAYIIGLVNPHGSGVSIMAATTPAQYSAEHSKLALAVADSMQFSKPETGPIVEQWKQALGNRRLTYMDSYYSSGPSYDGYSTGGGYSSKTVIDLCAAGHFQHSSRSSVSVDTGGAFGSSAGSGGGAGRWEVAGGPQGTAVLVLSFHDGNRQEYTLDYQDDKTLLNGKRWFRTNDAACQ